MKAFFAWVHTYERHLSASSMVGGFVLDNVFFTRIDLPATHVLFVGYLLSAAVAIGIWHYLEEHSVDGARRPKWHSFLPIVIQFAFGGLWSGILIFFSRSGSLAASWPFLLLLGAIFLGNEVFRKYHSLLVFNAVLYFFALFAYAIIAVPVVTHDMGTRTFVLSGIVAIAVYAAFLMKLRLLGRFRFFKSIWPIRLWVGVVFILINAAYFTNILPPLPLALKEAGIYHEVTRTSPGYTGLSEDQSWYTMLGFAPLEHIAPGEALYAYTAVFAPVKLKTEIVHQWEHYDAVEKKWSTRLRVPFSIIGGRDGGYRGYSLTNYPEEGKWRVDIETQDGRLIGRISFYVDRVAQPVLTTLQVLD